VPQVVQLFSGSVRENVAFGDTRVTDEAIRDALTVVGALGFVDALPEGLDTVLSGGRSVGAQLSSGQRQLVALARALACDPPVLLLDEATAAIDAASDSAFRAALRASITEQGRGVLTVAHRLATARDADRVIVLDDGRVIEEGAPEDLIRRGGQFASLVELEAAGWDWRHETPTAVGASL
jgi:ATP-binding cassette subfamily B protein